MAEKLPDATTSKTVTLDAEEEKEGDEVDQGEKTVKLKLQKKASTESRKVTWTEETVDNEHLNRKKSKCCCIYVKPKKFVPGEEESSDDSSGDECEHCPGHHGNDLKKNRGQDGSDGGPDQTA